MKIRDYPWIVVLALFGTSMAQQSQSVPQRAPITRDLSNGATFTFKVGPELPEFTFQVIPEVRESDKEGNPDSTIQNVEVFRADAKQPLQRLEDCEWGGMEAPPRVSEWFRAVDMNFDGYKDIYILTNWGATGNELGCVWLYDVKSGRFEFSKEFSELGRFELHPETKTITTRSNGGAAGTIFRAAKYVVEDDRPVAVMTVAQDFDFASKEYHCVVQQRRGHENTLVTVRDVRAKATVDFEGPCDASDSLRGAGKK